ncbi:MAG: cysteine desulfurase [Lachnospiraceae bacterium]|nr:cysteine desulfurase [Lachnospiraceae bacterium]
MNEIYLDNSATTRCYDEVADLMAEIMKNEYGNPSSLHHKGVEAEKYIIDAKKTIASILKVDDKEIVFTSGGTESDATALIGCAMANKRAGMHLITTRVEHPAILENMAYLEKQGFTVTYLPVGRDGRISLSDLEASITDETILVSIMHTNNEIGALMPIAEAGALIKRKNPNTLFHVDAVQGFGKALIYPKKMNIDLMSVSGHKIHGPKGVGLLYVRDKVKMNPLMLGGGQQKGMRSGTENVPGIAGIAKAAELIYQGIDAKREQLFKLKKALIEGLNGIGDVTINGIPEEGIENSAPHIVSASFAGVRSEVLLHALEDRDIYVSSGSACASNKAKHPSDTLSAIGLDKSLLDSTLRFSFSVFTTKEEIDEALTVLREIVPMLRRYTRH